ncbi:MAG: hypothetical protein ACETWQ_08835 [Phycisphaerae bacterium]
MADNVEEKLDALVARVTKVRRWLVAIAVLKIAALSLVFVSVYVGVYAWLDHRKNFDEIGRIIALILLLTGLVLLLYRLTKWLLVHVSFSEAANYIENIRSFDQQLVTAIEYYENKQDYPYSRALAEQLVLNVDKESEAFKFDSTVEKWKGYALSAVILFGLATAWFYVHNNYVYFSKYFARLTRPLASVEPLSPTSLESITRDIITEPDSEVTFAAGVKGRVPEFGKLVLVALEPQTKDNSRQTEREEMLVQPGFDEEKTAKFETSKSFSQTGRFKYRFESGLASTDWNKLTVCEPPVIESMMADVALPKRLPRRKWVRPYTEQVQNNTLEVIQRSDVTLNVQTTDKLKEVVVTSLDGKQLTKLLNGAQQFSYSFNADTSGSIKFHLVNEQGLANNDVPDLEVRVKTDEPPKFKLVSPEGDYLATDVASVPIIFEVTDDFGLDSVNMYLEIPAQQPEQLVIPVEDGARSKIFTHIIELERYSLNVGDSVLFYAQATDIDTGSALEKRTSRSDMYFIEIRPYRQNWRPRPGGGPSQGGGSPPVELLNILEYTRALLKKTWSIAGKSNPTEQDRSRLEFINNDVQYCAEQLALIRDDSEYGFNETQKAVLNAVLGYYEQAGKYLTERNATSAIVPEKNAYRVLRKFILELDLELNPPESGKGQQAQQPDSVKLQEMQEFSQEDKERIEAELKKLQQKLKKLTREQKTLKRTFENFLEQQEREKKIAQRTNDSKPSSPGDENQAQSRGPDKQQSQDRAGQKGESTSGSAGSESQSASKSQSTGKGKAASDSPSASNKQDSAESQSGSQSQSSGKDKSSSGSPSASNKQNSAESQGGSKEQSVGKDKSASDGQGPGSGKSAGEEQIDAQKQGSAKPGAASAQARLRMLQAKQRALQEQVSQLKRDLQRLPEISESGQNKGRAEAQKHLDEAVVKMDDFQDRLTEARYQADIDRRKSNEAVQLMELARSQLDLAKKSLDDELILSDEESVAQKAQEMAEQLADDADALDESVTPLEREEMLARLEAAKRLLERMPEPQWATIRNKDKGTSSSAQVFTRNPNLAPAEAARRMARQFWSIAINAKKYRQQLIEDEPSDVKFYRQENEFFENAAKFDHEAVKK